LEDLNLFPGRELEIEYFALSHGLSVEQVQVLVGEHSHDRVELVRAAARLQQTRPGR